MKKPTTKTIKISRELHFVLSKLKIKYGFSSMNALMTALTRQGSKRFRK